MQKLSNSLWMIAEPVITAGSLTATSPNNKFRLCHSWHKEGFWVSGQNLGSFTFSFAHCNGTIITLFSWLSSKVFEGKIVLFDFWKCKWILLNKRIHNVSVSVHLVAGLPWRHPLHRYVSPDVHINGGVMRTLSIAKRPPPAKWAVAKALSVSENLWKQSQIEIWRKARQIDVNTIMWVCGIRSTWREGPDKFVTFYFNARIFKVKENEGKKVVLPLPAGAWKDAKDFRSHGYKKNPGGKTVLFYGISRQGDARKCLRAECPRKMSSSSLNKVWQPSL